jgi:hypothetical protein
VAPSCCGSRFPKIGVLLKEPTRRFRTHINLMQNAQNVKHKAAAILAALAVFFSQLAVAAHPCPQLTAAMAATAATDVQADSTEPAVEDDCGCPSDEKDPSALCKKHCENGNQNLAISTTPDLSFVPAFEIRLALLDPIACLDAVNSASHVADPPFAHRKAVLRI